MYYKLNGMMTRKFIEVLLYFWYIEVERGGGRRAVSWLDDTRGLSGFRRHCFQGNWGSILSYVCVLC